MKFVTVRMYQNNTCMQFCAVCYSSASVTIYLSVYFRSMDLNGTFVFEFMYVCTPTS